MVVLILAWACSRICSEGACDYFRLLWFGLGIAWRFAWGCLCSLEFALACFDACLDLYVCFGFEHLLGLRWFAFLGFEFVWFWACGCLGLLLFGVCF